MDNKDRNKSNNSEKLVAEDNELMHFFIGIILLGAGLFMLSKRVMVYSGWYIWHLGGFDLASGTITIPLIIGIIWYFMNPKSIVSKIIIVLSVIFIILSIIMSVRINFTATSMFDYILIFGMVAAGSGLLIRTLLKKRS